MYSFHSNNKQKETKANKNQNDNFNKSNKREVISMNIKNSNNQHQKANKKGKKNIEFRNKINIEEYNEPENPNIKAANLTTKNNPVITEIEYEKVTSKDIVIDEDDNYNVYFMKPVFKSKTITVSKKQKPNFKINSKNKYKIDLNNNNINIDEDEDQNPYNTNEYNDTEPQFEKNPEIMPLESKNNEREFKAHLVQRLKSYKIKQAENNKIPLNIASKIRREESIRYSLKHLLAKQSQAIDAKKELIYYKGYFRFWKKKCKMVDELKFKKRFKKDRNIRITTVIYKAEKPHRSKNLKQKVRPEIIQEQKEIEKFRQNLIINLEQRQKERLSSISNDNAKYNSKTLNDLNNKF